MGCGPSNGFAHTVFADGHSYTINTWYIPGAGFVEGLIPVGSLGNAELGSKVYCFVWHGKTPKKHQFGTIVCVDKHGMHVRMTEETMKRWCWETGWWPKYIKRNSC